MQVIARFLINEEAATAVEYAVMLAMILMSIFAAVAAFGQQAGGMWSGIGNNLNSHGFSQ